jgi:hypothetical protein
LSLSPPLAELKSQLDVAMEREKLTNAQKDLLALYESVWVIKFQLAA